MFILLFIGVLLTPLLTIDFVSKKWSRNLRPFLMHLSGEARFTFNSGYAL